MSDGEVLIKVEDISKKFCRDLKLSLWYGLKDLGSEILGRTNCDAQLRLNEFWALKNLNFELGKGESLGLIGFNGAGKSTLLKLLNGLIKPNEGRITIRGSVGALIELGAGFNPILTGRENIYNNSAVLGLSKKAVDKFIDGIIDFSGIEDFIDMPVQSYSSGMRVRLGYAVAAYIKPDILLVDEVLAVGDTGFQRKCLQNMQNYLKQGGSLILVSHNMHLVQSICKKALLLDRGNLKFMGSSTEAINAYYKLQHTSQPQVTTGKDRSVQLSDENPVVIEKVEISPTNGDMIRSGESVKVKLYYQSIKDIEPVTWGFSIWTGDQWIRITTANATFSGYEYQILKDKGIFNCTIPSLPLVAGRYMLKAGIYDKETSWPIARIGWEDSAVPFRVRGSAREIDNRRLVDGDIIYMDVKWLK